MLTKVKIDSLDKDRTVTPLKVILYSVLNVFVIFRINILFLPNYMYILAILGLGLMIFHKRYFDDNLLKLVVTIAGMTIYAIMIMMLNSTGDGSYVKFIVAFVYKIMTAMFSFAVFKLMFGKNGTLLLFMKTFVYSCLILVASTLILVFFDPLNKFWLGTVVPRNPLIDEGYFYRISLIGYTGFDELSVFGVSTFFCAYIINDRVRKNEKYTVQCLIFVILAIGGMLYGRTSMFSTLFALVALFVMLKGTKNKLKVIEKFLVIGTVCFGAILICSTFVSGIRVWLNWAFELIIKLFKGGDSGIGSLNSLWKMYRFPDNALTLLFGDGRYFDSVNNIYYQNTDVGFLRAIYYYGLVGMMANYGLIIGFAMGIWKLFKRNKQIFILLATMIIHIFVLELKGVMFDSAIYYLSVLLFFGQDYNRECEEKPEIEQGVKNKEIKVEEVIV